MEPNTVFESITGVPAPRDEVVVAEPMNMENAGAACDFCPNGPFVGIKSPSGGVGPPGWPGRAVRRTHARLEGGWSASPPAVGGLVG
ncbi:hypothetical protein [Streptomyces tuirus]